MRGCEWFEHASNEGGRAVSFIQKYYGKSYVEVMSMLLGESMELVYPQAKKHEAAQQKPFVPPVPNANMHRVFAYLLKTRGLDADVVSYFARRKLLYEDAALNTSEQGMASVMSTVLSHLNAFLDSELEQVLRFDSASAVTVKTEAVHQTYTL